MNRGFSWFVVAGLMIALASLPAQPGRGEDPPADVGDRLDASQREGLRKLIDESIHWYVLRASADSPSPMKPLVVMRWPNSIRGSATGATVVWENAGRPEAVASVYNWQNKFVFEFDSLSRGTFEAERDDTVVWSPKTAGVEFRAIPDAPLPARSAKLRLRQMKTLSNQFQSTLLGWRDDGSQLEQLRLIRRPLYRYQIAEPDKVIDGALFAFVAGTDPESLLLIEAVPAGEKLRWEYAFVRQTSGALEGRFDGEIVWRANKHPPVKNPRSTHVQFNRVLKEVLPKAAEGESDVSGE